MKRVNRIGRTLIVPLLVITFAGCEEESVTKVEMTTIENSQVLPGVTDPPPILSDATLPAKPMSPTEVRALAVKNARNKKSGKQIEEASTEPQKRLVLPFAPAIGMDPVDGDKVSLRVGTPTVEYKGKVYYFTSEDNRRIFVADPEKFVKGSLARYQ